MLSAVPFDLEAGAVTGPAQVIARDLAPSHDGFNYSYTISQEGTLAYVELPAQDPAWQRQADLVWLDSDCSVEPLGTDMRYLGFRVSPNGRLALAQAMPREGSGPEVWLIDLETAALARTAHSTYCRTKHCREPMWLGDSATYLFGVGRGRAEGGALARASIQSDAIDVLYDDVPGWADVTPAGLLADGETVVYSARDQTGEPDLFVLAPGETPRRLDVSTDAPNFEPRVSPDQRWIAYTSSRGGDRRIFIASLESPGAQAFEISGSDGRRARWSADSRRVYFERDRTIHAVVLQIGADRFSASIPQAVCPDFRVGEEFELLPDGRILAIPGAETEIDVVQIVQDWPQLLDQSR